MFLRSRSFRVLRLWKILLPLFAVLFLLHLIPQVAIEQLMYYRRILGLSRPGSHERTGSLGPYFRTGMSWIDVTRQVDHCSQHPPSAKPLIPKYVHFVRVMDRDDHFGMLHYFSIRSAHEKIKPERIFYHHRGLPSDDNEWWRRARPMLTDLVEQEDVTEIFGHPVHVGAHKADVIRLRELHKWGGIYLDTDVIVTKSFDSLLHHEMVLGIEGMEPYIGLCNAIILSAPNATFLQRWYDSYRTFDDSRWSDHSVIMPYTLSKTASRDELCVLPTTSFFWPAYFNNHIKFVHTEDEWDFYNDFQYAAHLYNTGEKYISQTTPDIIRNTNTSFTRLVRPYLPDDA
ncbi:hypothetical protein DFJ77DRAFT_472916 [Powellomyces hirtus]|nr:hypothetical protein DFJ77DRAFT_472916 [Powellomyces hirtus]